MNIFQELKERGIINNITNEDKLAKFINKKGGVYVGFDPSFKSLHLGNYCMIVALKKINLAGFKTIALVGGATGMIGDPSGKKSERVMQSIEAIKNNIEGISKQLIKYTNSEIFNNADIYDSMSVIDFLRDVGKFVNVNYMLEKDIVKSRLESGISYTEFSYSLLQSNDFLWLYKNKGIQVQMGGSDQWGNITAGVEMIRKVLGDSNEAFGVTINLLTKADGTKFGKSESGAVYLDPSITSPHQMYQFLINQTDADVQKLLNCLTFYSLDEIKEIMTKHNENPSDHYAQKMLAKAVVADIHGLETLNRCEAIAKALFSGLLNELSNDELFQALKDTPSIEVKENHINILEALIQLKIANSKSSARQLIASKSINVNGKIIESHEENLTVENAFDKKFSYIKKGKKNYFIVNWVK